MINSLSKDATRESHSAHVRCGGGLLFESGASFVDNESGSSKLSVGSIENRVGGPEVFNVTGGE